VEILGGLVGLLLGGLLFGAIARFALPGPDPLPLWGTIGVGVGGALLGGTVMGLLQPAVDPSAPEATGSYFVASVLGAVFVLFVYRRFVQRRPLTGPQAKLPPARRRAGRAPAAGRPPLTADERADPLGALGRLVAARDAGEVDAAEFERRKAALVNLL
jgi:uncharacterized membrane protein YeaQ/YmgE (transglycosylase-associated protein family)